MAVVDTAAEDPTDHSDNTDLDHDLLRMSADAMAILNSISDEVNEISATSPKGKGSNLDDSFSEFGYEHNSSKTQAVIMGVSTAEKETKSKIVHIDDLDVDDDDTVGDLSLGDGSIADEFKSLRDIQKEIERELQSHDEDAMHRELARIQQQQSPPLKTRKVLDVDDKEIIDRILKEEKSRSLPQNIALEFIERYHLFHFETLEYFQKQRPLYQNIGGHKPFTISFTINGQYKTCLLSSLSSSSGFSNFLINKMLP